MKQVKVPGWVNFLLKLFTGTTVEQREKLVAAREKSRVLALVAKAFSLSGVPETLESLAEKVGLYVDAQKQIAATKASEIAELMKTVNALNQERGDAQTNAAAAEEVVKAINL